MGKSDLKATIQDILATILDPELPCTIIELGLVEDVRIDGSDVVVTMMPTFVGCPALEMIERDVTRQVSALSEVSTCSVTWQFEPAWSIERVNEEGKRKLLAHGVTPCNIPSAASLTASGIACPTCDSTNTRMESRFGPTRCRSIWFCDDCRNGFERMRSPQE